MNAFNFQIIKEDNKTRARLGRITTPHGVIETPAFVPVGTQATVKCLTPEDLHSLGVQMYFVNTYHMYLRPGVPVIKKFKGLHNFMHWDGPLITDSGGFQVFSLGRGRGVDATETHAKESLVKITDDGVEFRSHWDGSKHIFTPESSMQWQWDIGADIHIAFDDCTPYPATPAQAKESMERTHRWARRSMDAHTKLARKHKKSGKPYQALYGSIQGSTYQNLREESAKYICSLDVDGIAIGGVSVGESKREMADVLDWVTPFLPKGKPRHLLGVGEIDDIFALVAAGVDTFDCVQPTRLARTGMLLLATATSGHKLDITKAIYARDTKPPEESCGCYTCAHFSRAYLHHLFHVREILAYRLATIHNIYVINRLVDEIRESIRNGTFLELKKKWL